MCTGYRIWILTLLGKEIMGSMDSMKPRSPLEKPSAAAAEGLELMATYGSFFTKAGLEKLPSSSGSKVAGSLMESA